MSKYLFLFRGQEARSPGTHPEEAQAHMMKWKIWMDTLAAKGIMLGGEPLDMPGKVLSGKAKKITDGPFVEGKEIVGGYLLVNARDMDEAVEISKGCPIFDTDGSLEVRPIQELNM
ncbi:MAG: hypothetical protein IPK99_02175 [Flavobacteriales bacterium]|nr:hypothetical protein [Flavobacteriales bacterium]